MINLNNDLLMLRRYDNGTHTMECKLGRKVYQLTIEKNSHDAFVTLSHGDESHMIIVERDALVEREALERIEELEAAQMLLRQFQYVR